VTKRDYGAHKSRVSPSERPSVRPSFAVGASATQPIRLPPGRTLSFLRARRNCRLNVHQLPPGRPDAPCACDNTVARRRSDIGRDG